jgi:hypothetical protein
MLILKPSRHWMTNGAFLLSVSSVILSFHLSKRTGTFLQSQTVSIFAGKKLMASVLRLILRLSGLLGLL